jgi:hypothetical protein
MVRLNTLPSSSRSLPFPSPDLLRIAATEPIAAAPDASKELFDPDNEALDDEGRFFGLLGASDLGDSRSSIISIDEEAEIKDGCLEEVGRICTDERLL